MAMKLCMGLQLDVTQVLKDFGVATLPNMAARARKLAKLVPVPMSNKCPYVRQIVPMSDKNIPVRQNVAKSKGAAAASEFTLIAIENLYLGHFLTNFTLSSLKHFEDNKK